MARYVLRIEPLASLDPTTLANVLGRADQQVLTMPVPAPPA
jgi:hypothetical protein